MVGIYNKSTKNHTKLRGGGHDDHTQPAAVAGVE